MGQSIILISFWYEQDINLSVVFVLRVAYWQGLQSLPDFVLIFDVFHQLSDTFPEN